MVVFCCQFTYHFRQVAVLTWFSDLARQLLQVVENIR